MRVHQGRRPQRPTKQSPLSNHLEVPTLSHQDKHASLPRPRTPALVLTVALALALVTACSRPPTVTPPPTDTPPPQQETPAPTETLIKATVHGNPTPTPQQQPTAFAFPDPGAGFAALGTTLVATENAGQTWTQVATFDAPITQLDFPTPDQGWAITQNDQLYSSKDGGRTWQYEHRIARQVDFVSPTHGFTLEGGALFATKDGGQTWRQTAASPCGDAGERWSSFLSFSSPEDGWIACGSQPGAGMQGKAIYRTRDGGVTWEGVEGPMGKAERFIADVAFLSPDRGYVLDLGIIYTTADGGQTWTPVLPALAPADALPLQMLGAHRWITAGTRLEGNVILMTDDAGKSWRRAGRLPEDYVDALLFTADAKAGWALGHHWAPDASYIQTVYRTEDGGATWAPRLQRTGVTFANLQMIDAETLIASTNTGEIQISRDGGQTFTPLNPTADQAPSHSARFISLEKGWRHEPQPNAGVLGASHRTRRGGRLSVRE
ncbi:MAG: hypothetical protein K0R39_319 [Symbiobacteriaceae bacterium]|jgi:photosystem II stability/assembly factor-like uncharacterized protein|nr:hypothetical protein [Symbiobacteriaceae bacterium]